MEGFWEDFLKHGVGSCNKKGRVGAKTGMTQKPKLSFLKD